MKHLASLAGVATLAFAGLASPAYAQATRTWVSGVGDDVNPCSRTAPCKTFAGAISKTAAGGQINCIDSGAYGAVTITKSISIICDDVEAGVLASSTNGIVINAAATDEIYLSGLDILGSSGGLNGIRILAAGAVYVMDTTIRQFNSTNGTGINFAPTAGSTLHLQNVVMTENGVGANGAGLLLAPIGTGAAIVSATNVTSNNNGAGIKIDTSGATSGQVSLTITNSTLANNNSNLNVTGPSASAGVLMTKTVIKGGSTGIAASGSGTTIRVSGSTITGNTTGIAIGAGAFVNSYGDNQLNGNTSDGAFSPGLTPKK